MQLDLLSWTPRAPVRAPLCPPPWSRADVLEMVRLYAQSSRPDIGAVARAMGKTYHQIASQASRIGLSFDALGPNAGLRRCMCCREDFWSPSRRQIHICPGCKGSSEFMECA